VSDYARIAMATLKSIEAADCDPAVAAYMVARIALLHVASLRGPERAAEMAYKLADEFAGECP
jgi:hypothetical protein